MIIVVVIVIIKFATSIVLRFYFERKQPSARDQLVCVRVSGFTLLSWQDGVGPEQD